MCSFNRRLHTGGALRVFGLPRLQGPPGHDVEGAAVQLPHGVVQEEPLLLKDHLPARRSRGGDQ